jgi:hypothetical protein
MFGLIVALLIIILLYRIFISGWLFKAILFLAFPFCAHIALLLFLPISSAVMITIGTFAISYAWGIPLIITILALGSVKGQT